MKTLKLYTVKQLAAMAGISVRALHYYDQIGLLSPCARTGAGYRLYGETELLRLQQILFYREVELPLQDIARILAEGGRDPLETLRAQKTAIEAQRDRMTVLIATIDKTISRLKGETTMLSDEELYDGLPKEKIQEYNDYAQKHYDPKLVAESNRRVRSMTKAQWKAVQQEGDGITRDLAALMDKPASDPAVQAVVARHYGWIKHFYTPTAEVYRGLGQLYATHPDFRARYDTYRVGLADFMKEAMEVYSRTL